MPLFGCVPGLKGSVAVFQLLPSQQWLEQHRCELQSEVWKWHSFSFLNVFLHVICWAMLVCCSLEIFPMRKNVKSEHVFAYISKSILCSTHLYIAKSICGKWFAQNLRESLWNSPGTAFCTGASKEKYEDMKGLWWHSNCWGCSDAQCMSEWVDVNPAATCWVGTIKFTLFPSLLGAPVMSIAVCRYCLCSRDYRCKVRNSGDGVTTVNKDNKPQVCSIYRV